MLKFMVTVLLFSVFNKFLPEVFSGQELNRVRRNPIDTL